MRMSGEQKNKKRSGSRSTATAWKQGWGVGGESRWFISGGSRALVLAAHGQKRMR